MINWVHADVAAFNPNCGIFCQVILRGEMDSRPGLRQPCSQNVEETDEQDF